MPTKADFLALGRAQRGTPEHAMLDAQLALGGGVLANAIEHVGDLMHRMNDSATWNSAGYEFMHDKVTKILKSLTNPYGFAREHEENMRSNAQYRKVPLTDYLTRAHAALDRYASAHAALRPLNPATTLCQTAAVTLGHRDFAGCTAALRTLHTHLATRDAWVRFAREGLQEGILPFAQYVQEMRCTEATLRAFGITGSCPLTGTGVLQVLQQHGYRVRPILNPDRTDGTYPLAAFVRTHPTGQYYLYTTDHAMALIDGILTDTSARTLSNQIRVSVLEVVR